MGKTVVKFDSAKWAQEILQNAINEQTRRLIEYAKKEIQVIGNKIQTYNSKNRMDRSGHLLNSLCWGVAYDGKLVESGFYRDEMLHTHTTMWEKNTTNSYLHEFIPEYEAFPVHGRQNAEQYIKRYGAAGSAKGCWRVFFAVLAPYWGYWEQGFKITHRKGNVGSVSFHKFAVMTQLYDTVSAELKPMKVKFEITKSINYVKSYHVSGIKKKSKSYVRGTIERKYDSFMRKGRK